MMIDKNLEEIFVTKNIPSIHPPNLKSPYDMKTEYFHLGVHTEEWEIDVLKNGAFIERWLAEKDDSIVQIIPYIICCTKDGRILSYTRKGGGENRLEGKRSIGIGGHVNIDDIHALDTGDESWDFILKGAVRELKEELTLKVPDEYIMSKLSEIGIIYTPLDGIKNTKNRSTTSTPPVGAVHLGNVYMLEVLENVRIKDNEGMIDPVFIEASEAYKSKDKYERWSSFILETLCELKGFYLKNSNKLIEHKNDNENDAGKAIS